MINEYLEYLREGYLFNDKTISIDLDKFISGESNKLIIAGLSGGGKTTLGNYLSKKYKCNFNEIDECNKKNMTREEYYNFIMVKTSAEDPEIFKRFWVKCFKPALLSNKREVIEGNLFQIYNLIPSTKPLINQYPVIILGKSALKAVWDRTQRTLRKQYAKEKYSNPKDRYEKYKRGVILNFKYLQKYLDQFRKERIKAGGDIQQFEIPKLKI